jgi:hypothetical protein
MTQTIGSRRQVWNGTAKRTSGGLTKSDLMMSHGRIVSKSKHFSAKKEMRLLKYGYGTKKGKFGYVKVGTKKHRKGHKKMRGGIGSGSAAHARVRMAGGSGYGPLSPADVDGSYMIKDVVPQDFSPLDRALVGGKRRRRRMRGGMYSLAPADVGATAVGGLMADGPVIGLTSYQGAGADDVQLRAGQSGGKRGRSRRMSKAMGKGMSKGMAMGKSMGMLGGTGFPEMSESAPLAAALGAS